MTEKYDIRYVHLGTIYEHLLNFLQAYPILWLVVFVHTWNRNRLLGGEKFKSFQPPELMPWLARCLWFASALIVGPIVFALYDVNIARHTERFGGLLEYLQFCDRWDQAAIIRGVLQSRIIRSFLWCRRYLVIGLIRLRLRHA